MENEWLELVYINYNKVIVAGMLKDLTVEIELTEEQKELVYDFNREQEEDKFNFLKGLIS